MALQLLHGDIEQLRREYMVLFTRGVSITRKLGFSDIIMPGRAKNLPRQLVAAAPAGGALTCRGLFRVHLGPLLDRRGDPPHEGPVAAVTKA